MTTKTPHRIEQERRILEAMKGCEAGHKEVAQATGLSRSGAQKYMERMHAEGMIHVSSHDVPKTGGYPYPRFSVGNSPDVIYEAPRVKKPKRSEPRSEEKRRKVLEALARPLTGHELGRAVFLSYEQAMKYVKELREAGAVFVQGWRPAQGQGQWAALYMVGKGKDKPHPGRESRASRYKKERANADRVELENKRRAHKRLVKSLGSKPASIFAALGV